MSPRGSKFSPPRMTGLLLFWSANMTYPQRRSINLSLRMHTHRLTRCIVRCTRAHSRSHQGREKVHCLRLRVCRRRRSCSFIRSIGRRQLALHRRRDTYFVNNAPHHALATPAFNLSHCSRSAGFSISLKKYGVKWLWFSQEMSLI